MGLPAIDIGFMTDHLSAHEGVIAKLKMYHSMTQNGTLKKILATQVTTMQKHVHTMLDLIYPSEGRPHSFAMDSSGHFSHEQHHHTEEDKHIALEAHSATKSMANSNFSSALMMKDPHVKQAHFKMAWEQATLEKEYADLIESMGWTYTPRVSSEKQMKTYYRYQHLLEE
ncbi:hypothetical protein [Bacillus fonticola]|uniref:hypothetical protein n=1 Tax=Bacillus fonticola TaxID=2728853 RepID=UPI001472A5B3|nr:hypothetical protein [Bacillus fonticola]